jgi:hypothetical protein
MSTPCFKAKFGPLLQITDGAANHFRFHVCCNFFDDHLELVDALRLASDDLGEGITPKEIIQWG